MQITLIPTTFEQEEALLAGYRARLTSPFDSFLEGYMLAGQPYRLAGPAGPLGMCVVDGAGLLSLLYIDEAALPAGAAILDQIVSELAVGSAFVHSGDESALCLLLDRECGVAKQAYYFQETTARQAVRLHPTGYFRPAAADDVPAILAVSGDFFGSPAALDGLELFLLGTDRDLLGIGIVERSQLLPGYASIGMFTNADFRRQGIGRTLIYRLRQWCHGMELTPIAGCWYHNHASRKTLESAGMVTRTRLFKINLAAVPVDLATN